MKRSLLALVAVLALAIAAYVIWTRRPPAFLTSITPASGVDKASPTTPRGDVTIDPRRQQLIGVKTVAVTRRSLAQAVRAVGAVRYNETRLTDVNVKVEGWIRELYVDATGQPVQKGQPLFTLYSPDLLNTQQEYLLALKTRDQLQQSTIADARSRADDLVASARQRLALWDLPADALRTLEENRQAVEAVVVRSPASGFVIEKQALTGLHVMPGQSLYKVADLSTVWVEADVYETELAGVRAGAARHRDRRCVSGRAVHRSCDVPLSVSRREDPDEQSATRAGEPRRAPQARDVRQRRADGRTWAPGWLFQRTRCSIQAPNRSSSSRKATGGSSRARSGSVAVSARRHRFSKA